MLFVMIFGLGSILYWPPDLLLHKQYASAGVHIKNASAVINNANAPASFIFSLDL